MASLLSLLPSLISVPDSHATMLPLSEVKISLSSLLEAVVVAGFIGAVVWTTKSSSNAVKAASDGSSGSSQKSKSKKKKAAGQVDSPTVEQTKPEKLEEDTRSAAAASPVQSAAAPTPAPKKKGSKSKTTVAPTPVVAPSTAPPPATASTPPSFASVASPASSTSTTPNEKKQDKKPLAERALRPEPKSTTSDMRDEELNPTPAAARVLKVVGGKSGAKPEPQERWSDEDGWEKVEEDGGWETAKAKSEFSLGSRLLEKLLRVRSSSTLTFSPPRSRRTLAFGCRWIFLLFCLLPVESRSCTSLHPRTLSFSPDCAYQEAARER